MHIELEHFRRADACANLLYADRGEGGYAEIGSEFLRCPGNGALALPVKQPLQGGGREEQWHGQFLAHDRRAHVDILDAGEHIGDQITAFIGFGIAPPGHLVVSRAIDIIEDRKGQALSGKRAEVVHIVAIRDIHNRLSIRRACATARRSRGWVDRASLDEDARVASDV